MIGTSFRIVLLVTSLSAAAGPMLGCSTSATPGEAGTDALQLAATGASDGSLRVVDSLPASTSAASGSAQTLAAGDILEVDVFQVDNLDRTVQIDASGKISLPLIGSVQAEGMTLRDLELEVERTYGAKYLQSPDVTIFVKESAGQRVTVDGEVAKAGLFPVTGNTTLLDAIAIAGGFRDIADAKKVFVYRDVGNQKLVANYNVEDIRQGKAANPRIYGGDVIVVFQSKSKIALKNLKEALGVASSASRLAVIP